MNIVGILTAWFFSVERPFLNGDFLLIYALAALRAPRWLTVLVALALVLLEWYVVFCQNFFYFNVWDLAALATSAGVPLLMAVLLGASTAAYAVLAFWIASSRRFATWRAVAVVAGIVGLALVLEKGLRHTPPFRDLQVDVVRFSGWSLLRTLGNPVERELHAERLAPGGEATFAQLPRPGTVHAELERLAEARADVIVVVVEALGFEPGPEWRQFLLDAVQPDGAARRIYVGADASFGFTAHGEIRILCDRKLSGLRIEPEQIPADCIPRRFADAGFPSRSFHGYHGTFYRRTAWYPALGFTEIAWAGDMGEARCPFVFVHVCDEDVVRYFLKHPRPPGPGFDYVLTLDAHLPFLAPVRDYIQSRAAAPLPGGSSAASAYELYRSVTRNTLAGVRDILVARPGATVVVTGDHAPYMLLGHPGAERLDRDRVSFLIIEPDRER